MIPQIAAFNSWCLDQGITTPLQLQGDSNYRYLINNNPQTITGDDIISVPLHACLIADTPESLAERLSYERSLGPDSKFAPYICMLPELEGNLASMPRFWNQERLERVQDGSQLQQKMKAATSTTDPTVDQWALACVNSHCNFLQDYRYSLTPLLDMMNHDASVETRAKVSTDQKLVLSIKQEIKTFDEVFISYGDLTNLETLHDYGFVSEDNPCNAESLDVRFIRQQPLRVTVTADGSINSDVTSALRQYLANSQELEECGGDFSKRVSDRNELDVASFLASTLSEAADEAQEGAETAKLAGDFLVETYLSERAKTLKGGIHKFLEEYPDLEY